MHAEPLCLLPEKSRDQSLDDIGLNFFRKTLADDRRRHMASPKAGQARHLLIFLNQRIGLARYFLRWDLNFNFALGGALVSFRGAHNRLSSLPRRWHFAGGVAFAPLCPSAVSLN